MSLLTLDHLRTDIGQHAVLHDVSLTVPEGGVFVLLGRNGAGKTTTLRSIMRLWRPSPGSVRFPGPG
jgi:branched-chain amino acid transport system ATP-binding protein